MKSTDPDRAAVSAIRSRYYAALAAGMSQPEAVAVANGKKLPARKDEAALAAGEASGPAPIPGDLSPLTWQQIRSLAIEHFGPDARAMKRHEIEAALMTKRDEA